MLDWIFPQTVEVVDSPINGQIKVVKSQGQYSVWVGGFQQSGPLVEEVWKKALSNLTVKQCNRVLILGFGCGSAAKLILQKWPKARITGVELDPEVIRIGEKYFAVANTLHLKVIKADAGHYVSKTKKTRQKFDMVLVDVYKGQVAGKLAKDIDKLITSNGIIIKNILEKTKRGFSNRLATTHSDSASRRRF